MKQTDNDNNNGPRAADPRIRNAGVVGSSPIRGTIVVITGSASSTPRSISQKRRIMLRLAEQTVISTSKGEWDELAREHL